jgi:hypothetical protein
MLYFSKIIYENIEFDIPFSRKELADPNTDLVGASKVTHHFQATGNHYSNTRVNRGNNSQNISFSVRCIINN